MSEENNVRRNIVPQNCYYEPQMTKADPYLQLKCVRIVRLNIINDGNLVIVRIFEHGAVLVGEHSVTSGKCSHDLKLIQRVQELSHSLNNVKILRLRIRFLFELQSLSGSTMCLETKQMLRFVTTTVLFNCVMSQTQIDTKTI